jgi:hypothetical protein
MSKHGIRKFYTREGKFHDYERAGYDGRLTAITRTQRTCSGNSAAYPLKGRISQG